MARMNKLALVACGCLAACGPIVDLGGASGPPPRIYAVSAQSGAQSQAALSQDAIVLIEEPFTSSVLDTDRIAVVLPGGEIQFLGGARWSDRPVRMTRRVLQDTLARVDGLTPLGRGALDIPNDYRLKVQLRDFQVSEQGGGPRSVVSLQAWLVDETGALMATNTFQASTDLPILDVQRAVAGVQADLTDAAAQLTRWLSEALNQQS